MEPPAAPMTLPAGPSAAEGVERLGADLEALGDDQTVARVAALLALVEALPVSEAERQAALAEEAYRLAETLGDDVGQARAAGLSGRASFMLAENMVALPRLAEAVARFDALGMSEDGLAARGALAGAHASLGYYEEAFEGALTNLDHVREVGDRLAEGWVLVGLSAGYADLGDADRALDAARQAEAAFAETGHGIGRARALTSIGTAYLLREDPDAAEAVLREALVLFDRYDDPIGVDRATDDLGSAARLRGDLEAGLALHRASLVSRRTRANRHAQSTSLLHVGEALVALGQPAEAVDALAEALTLARSTGARPREAQVHAALVDAHVALGDTPRALAAARALLAVREETLDAETRARLQTMQVRYETEQLREAQEAEAARASALRAANARLVDALEELRSAQRQLVQTEKLASLGRVTAGIAHEIRNPLNFVVGFSGLATDLVAEIAETLAAHPISDAGAAETVSETLGLLTANVARIDEHARRANGIVTSMLEHVRTVGGPRGQVVVMDLLDAALDDVAVLRPDGLRIVRDADGADLEVEAVAGSLRRVFANLIGNAYSALADRAEDAPPGWTPTLSVAVRRVLESAIGPAVEVSIADNGAGFASAETRARVFEPFFTTRPTGQGTGLGLSLAYDIVTQAHGGLLEAHDTPGGGATFVVMLPAA